MSRPRLRAKTGCLACRSRKIKCDETRPCCAQCLHVGRLCRWPRPEDLYDRRHRRNRRNSSTESASSSLSPLSADSPPAESRDVARTVPCRQPSPPSPAPVAAPIEGALLHHYAGTFVPVLLLPGADDRFFESQRWYIFGLMQEDPGIGLQSAVLAFTASNQYVRTGHPVMRHMARRYYARAVEEVHAGVRRLEQWLERRDHGPDQSPLPLFPTFPLLVAVIFLYLDGFWGLDNAPDALPHITGAMHLLHLHVAYEEEKQPKKGCAQQQGKTDGVPSPAAADRSTTLTAESKTHASPVLSPNRPYDRIAVESILYQAFLMAVRDPFAAKFPLDVHLLIRTERLLNTFFAAEMATESLDQPAQDSTSSPLTTFDSPVLGAPVSIFRLVLAIVAYCHAPWRLQADTLADMRASLDAWEACVGGLGRDHDDSEEEDGPAHGTNQPPSTCPLYTRRLTEYEVAKLFVLMASLLLDGVSAAVTDGTNSGRRGVQQYVMGVACGKKTRRHSDTRRDFTAEDDSGTASSFASPPWQARRALALLRRPDTADRCSGCYLGLWPLKILGYAVTHTPGDVALVRGLLRRMCRVLGYGESQRMLDDLEVFWKDEGKEV